MRDGLVLLAAILLILVSTSNILYMHQDDVKDMKKEVYWKAFTKKLYKKYQWKSERLKTYTDLVYNVNGGAVYE